MIMVSDFDVDLDVKWDFTKMIPNLEEEYIKTLENHDREIDRIRERNNMNHERNRVKAVYEDSSFTPRKKPVTGSSIGINEGEAS